MELTPGLNPPRAFFSSGPEGWLHIHRRAWVPEFPAQDTLPRGTVSNAPALTHDGAGTDPVDADQNELSSPRETALPASHGCQSSPQRLFERYGSFPLKTFFIDTHDLLPIKEIRKKRFLQFLVKMINLCEYCSIFLSCLKPQPLYKL